MHRHLPPPLRPAPQGGVTLLLLSLLACKDPCADGKCDTGDVGHTGDTAVDDTSETGTSDDPWDQPGYWAEGSPIDVVLDLSQEPSSSFWEVRMNLSTDGWMTNDDYIVVAHSLSSLDLMVYDDALIILGGLDLKNLSLGEDGEAIRWGYLYAITTTDLSTWGSHVWPVEDAASGRMTDPALSTMPDGRIRAIYYSTPLEAEGDPAWIEGQHPIKEAFRDGEVFREVAADIYSDEGLVDPVACDHDGTFHYFSTKSGEITHATSATGESFVHDDAFTWGGNQVPYCYHDDDGNFRVVGQIGGGIGTPSWREMNADGTFTDPTFLYDDPTWFGGNCSSPVLGRFNGYYVTLCASWAG